MKLSLKTLGERERKYNQAINYITSEKRGLGQLEKSVAQNFRGGFDKNKNLSNAKFDEYIKALRERSSIKKSVAKYNIKAKANYEKRTGKKDYDTIYQDKKNKLKEKNSSTKQLEKINKRINKHLQEQRNKLSKMGLNDLELEFFSEGGTISPLTGQTPIETVGFENININDELSFSSNKLKEAKELEEIMLQRKAEHVFNENKFNNIYESEILSLTVEGEYLSNSEKRMLMKEFSKLTNVQKFVVANSIDTIYILLSSEARKEKGQPLYDSLKSAIEKVSTYGKALFEKDSESKLVNL